MLLVSLFAGCAHTGLGPFAHVEPNAGFKTGELDLKAKWQVFDSGGADIAFIARDLNAGIAANVICEQSDANNTIEDLAPFHLFGITSARRIEKEYLELDGEKFLRQRFMANQEGTPLEIELYLTVFNSCVYDLEYAASREDFEKGLKDFKQFISGFQFIGSIKKAMEAKPKNS